jgi:hypothetical protein
VAGLQGGEAVKRLLLFFLLGLTLACSAPIRMATVATYPLADSVRVVMTPDAARFIDSLARVTRATRKEQAACVEDYGILPTAKRALLIGLIEVGPSNAYDSDSLKVWTRNGRDFCGPGIPNLHTHIVPNEVWHRPSDFDLQQAMDWPVVRFRVVVSVPAKGPPKVTIYGIR